MSGRSERLRISAPAQVKYDCVLTSAMLEGVAPDDQLSLRMALRPSVGDGLEARIELGGGRSVYADLRVEDVVREASACVVTARAHFPHAGEAAEFAEWVRQRGVRIVASQPSRARPAAPGTRRASPAPAPSGNWLVSWWERLTG